MNLRNSFIKKDSTKVLYRKIFDETLRGQQTKATSVDFVWYVLVLIGWSASYIFALNSSGFLWMIVLGGCVGFFSATSGLSCAHEIVHSASFRSRFMTSLGGFLYTDLLTGVSSANWRNSHNLFHHNNTNVNIGDKWVDPDLVDMYKFKKIFKNRKYLLGLFPFMFGAGMFAWTTFSDVRILISKVHDKNADLKYSYSKLDWSLTWVFKAIYLSIIIYPLFRHSLSEYLVFLFMWYQVQGLYLGIIFLIAPTQFDFGYST